MAPPANARHQASLPTGEKEQGTFASAAANWSRQSLPIAAIGLIFSKTD
jgi:hypothetical protein